MRLLAPSANLANDGFLAVTRRSEDQSPLHRQSKMRYSPYFTSSPDGQVGLVRGHAEGVGHTEWVSLLRVRSLFAPLPPVPSPREGGKRSLGIVSILEAMPGAA
jgi:hypothetical protein